MPRSTTIAAIRKTLDPSRLEVLRKLALLDTPAEEAFDRVTRLASKMVKAPVSLVSLVDADRQFFKSFVGLPEPWASVRQTPLTHSFCQHVVDTGEPLVVADARTEPMLKDNLAIPDLNVIAYLGIPITTQTGAELGSFCVIDGKPRTWTSDEIEIVRELTKTVIEIIELRGQLLSFHSMAEERMMVIADLKAKSDQRTASVVQLFRETVSSLDQAVAEKAEVTSLRGQLDAASSRLSVILN